MRVRTYPTAYAMGPYRLVRLSHRGGFAVRDERRTGRAAYAVTEPHPNTGRPIPHMMPLPAALAALRDLATEDSQRL